MTAGHGPNANAIWSLPSRAVALSFAILRSASCGGSQLAFYPRELLPARLVGRYNIVPFEPDDAGIHVRLGMIVEHVVELAERRHDAIRAPDVLHLRAAERDHRASEHRTAPLRCEIGVKFVVHDARDGAVVEAVMVADRQEECLIGRDAGEQQRPRTGHTAIGLLAAEMQVVGIDGDAHPVLAAPVSFYPFVVRQRRRGRWQFGRIGVRPNLGREIGIHIVAVAEGGFDVRYFGGVGRIVAGGRDFGPDHHVARARADKPRLPGQVTDDHLGQRLGRKLGLRRLVPGRDAGGEIGLEPGEPGREVFGIGHGGRILSRREDDTIAR